jgi:hypothetical protein
MPQVLQRGHVQQFNHPPLVPVPRRGEVRIDKDYL